MLAVVINICMYIYPDYINICIYNTEAKERTLLKFFNNLGNLGSTVYCLERRIFAVV